MKNAKELWKIVRKARLETRSCKGGRTIVYSPDRSESFSLNFRHEIPMQKYKDVLAILRRWGVVE